MILRAIIIDEAHAAHLIEDWGDEFRVKFRELDRLRAYTAMSVPFLACSATASTKTFCIIWDELAFGCRPFWGMDVGCERPNLTYIVRAQAKQLSWLEECTDITHSKLAQS